MLEKLFAEGLPDYSKLEEIIDFPSGYSYEDTIKEEEKIISRNQTNAYIESSKIFFS